MAQREAQLIIILVCDLRHGLLNLLQDQYLSFEGSCAPRLSVPCNKSFHTLQVLPAIHFLSREEGKRNMVTLSPSLHDERRLWWKATAV